MFETIEFYYDKHFCIKYYSSIIHVYICTSANLESHCDQLYFMQFYGRFDFKAFGFFLIAAFLLHGGVQITLMLWVPDPDRVYLFYIFAALWGMGDAVIQTQINGKKFMNINLTLDSLLSLWRFWLRGQRDTKWADIKI